MVVRSALLAVGLASLLSGCDQGEAESVVADPTVVFGQSQATERTSSPCVIRARTLVKIKSEVAGRVNVIDVAPGDVIAKEALLASIDTHALKNDLERNGLAQRRVQSEMKLLRLQGERARRAKQAIDEINSRAEYLSAAARSSAVVGRYGTEAMEMNEREASLEQLSISLQDMQLQEREIIRNLGLAQIRSPLDGVVLSRFVEEGAIVGSGTSQFGGGDVLFEVADVGTLRAECYARESESWNLRVGMPAKVTLDVRSNRAVEAAITHVSPAVEMVSGVPRLKFEADFVPPDAGWRVGANAAIAIEAPGTSSSNTLPASAVGTEGGKQWVRVRRGRAFLVTPVVAQREGLGWVVTKGIADGDLVAVSFNVDGARNGQ